MTEKQAEEKLWANQSALEERWDAPTHMRMFTHTHKITRSQEATKTEAWPFLLPGSILKIKPLCSLREP